jgi:TRAP-type C4-dicarboxylate transport system permease small subunit
LVEAGIAFAIFAFLPICHLSGGHATVDIFTSKLPVGLNRFLRMVIEVVFAAVLVLIAVRLYAGTMSKLNYGETTFLLQFPIWWAYAASLFGSIIAAVVSVYIALMCIIEAFTGREILPTPADAFH